MTQRARRPEAACAGVAPAAVSPCSTMAKDEAKPTTAARKPAKMGWAAGPLAGAEAPATEWAGAAPSPAAVVVSERMAVRRACRLKCGREYC
jgi:hypothetical protein